MTNTIQLSSSLTDNVMDKEVVSKYTASVKNSIFNSLFSTLLADINSGSEIKDNIFSSNNQFSSFVIMMVSKIFGNNESEVIVDNVPEGTPVMGVLTQVSHEGHTALDFGVAVGTNVKTTMTGKVTFAGWNNEGYGNLVIIDNGLYKTYYAHLSKIPVYVGQQVNEGEVIGLSGNTGNSTGPHLHYEIRKNGIAVNPLYTLSD